MWISGERRDVRWEAGVGEETEVTKGSMLEETGGIILLFYFLKYVFKSSFFPVMFIKLQIDWL